MKTIRIILLMLILTLQVKAIYIPKPDFHKVPVLTVVNKKLYASLDTILNSNIKGKYIKEGAYFEIRFGTYLASDLFTITALGTTPGGYRLRVVGVFRYKMRNFIVVADSLDVTLFKKTKIWIRINFVDDPSIRRYTKKGVPIYDRTQSYITTENYCYWAFRYKEKKFKSLAFISKYDSGFNNIEKEYPEYPKILSTPSLKPKY